MNRWAGTAGFALLACGGATPLEVSGSDATSKADSTAFQADSSSEAETSSPSCNWPSIFDDGGASLCSAGRVLVDCSGPSGRGCICLTSGDLQCESCGPDSGNTCNGPCANDEYGLACDAMGPVPDAAVLAPSTCRFVLARHVPPTAGAPASAFAYYCCPCE